MRVIPSEEYNKPVESTASEQKKEIKKDSGYSKLFSLLLQRVGTYLVMILDSNAKGLAGYVTAYGECKTRALNGLIDLKCALYDSQVSESIDAIESIKPCTASCVIDLEMNLLDTIDNIVKDCKCPIMQKRLKHIASDSILNLRLLNTAAKLEEINSDSVVVSNALYNYVRI